KLMVLGAASNMIFCIILVKYLGITGASTAYLISSGIILAISFRWARKIVKIILYRDRLLKILAALASGLPFIYAIKVISPDLFLAFILSLVILPIVYFIMLMVFKTFREEDMFLVKNVLGGTKLSESIIQILKKGIS
ncbi:MAG TPA: polysaccharide biosynthesis C-terminal domain-containing protein, partial [Candidatus Methanoperedens sp.]